MKHSNDCNVVNTTGFDDGELVNVLEADHMTLMRGKSGNERKLHFLTRSTLLWFRTFLDSIIEISR